MINIPLVKEQMEYISHATETLVVINVIMYAASVIKAEQVEAIGTQK